MTLAPWDPGLQNERTGLAWQRTMLAGLTCRLLVARLLASISIIFGWMTYLLARGLWSRRPAQVVVAVLVLLVYGGLIWGVFPSGAGISWQAHLGGAVAGVLAAWLLHRRATRQAVPAAPIRRY